MAFGLGRQFRTKLRHALADLLLLFLEHAIFVPISDTYLRAASSAHVFGGHVVRMSSQRVERAGRPKPIRGIW